MSQTASDISQCYLDAVLDHVSDVVAIIDGSGRLRCASPQLSEIIGFDPLDLVGLRALAFVHPDDRLAVLRMFAAVDNEKAMNRKVMTRIAMATGEFGIYELRASRFDRPPGDGGLIVSMHDVTEKHRLENELARVHRLESIGRLAGAVAHDFNNLLTAIRSYAVFARESLAVGEIPDDDLKDILASTDRGEMFTRQLLAFARRQVHEPRLLDLGELVRGAHRLLSRLAGESYRVHVDIQPDLWPVYADPAQLEQCLVNLVMNAVEAMPDGGEIDISAANLGNGFEHEVEPIEGECVSLSVKDRGPGLCPQAREHLFEPFFTTKKPGQGEGLGLAVVYGVVRKHGGRVIVDSAPGAGALVRLVIPRADRQTGASRSTRVGPTAPMVGVALVAEDNELVRSVISRALVEAGLVVHECVCGVDALEVAARLGDELDLVVTDIVMPQMGGLELANRLRVDEPALPVLYVTGYADDAAALMSRLGPRDRLLRKPFSMNGLIEAVSELLEGSPVPLEFLPWDSPIG
jgi:PAS domain S-box-containing protein